MKTRSKKWGVDSTSSTVPVMGVSKREPIGFRCDECGRWCPRTKRVVVNEGWFCPNCGEESQDDFDRAWDRMVKSERLMGDRLTARKRLLEKLNVDPSADWRVIARPPPPGCDQDPRPDLAGVAGLIARPPKTLKHFPGQRFRPYAELQFWRDERSDMTVGVESAPTRHWIRYPFRMTFNADDGTGVLPKQLLAVLEVVPQIRLLLLEISFDYFGDLTPAEVRRLVLFGKARPANSGDGVYRWGTGRKLAKVYGKPETGGVRAELELGPHFLQKYAIEDVFDFGKLATILPSHISLNALNQQKLAKRLAGMRIGTKRKQAILRLSAKSDGAVWPVLQLLRSKEIGIKNTRRLLDAHPINAEAMKALKDWAAQWPPRKTRLGK